MTTNTKTDLREFTKQELIELLTTDVAGWNRLYQEAREASDCLWSADLRSADLRSADLRYANLGSANLRYANLRSADLRSADLRYANLGSANLRYANQLDQFKLDVWNVLDTNPAEVAKLRELIVAGKINGSVYEGDCACLCGSIANLKQVDVHDAAALGVDTNSSSPAEQWFLAIMEGDKPVSFDPDAEDLEWSSEGVFRASWVLRWVDEWLVSRTAIAKALTGTGVDAEFSPCGRGVCCMNKGHDGECRQ